MIASKFWQSLRAQLNKIANAMWHADPIALMQFEYDRAVEQLRDGRAGLVQYRAIVERLQRQADSQRSQAARLVATIEAYLQAGDRNAAAGRALELQNLRQEAGETESLLTLHEQAYANNLAKIRQASASLAQLHEKINRYHAELQMSQAEAEIAALAQDFQLAPTTDLGRIEQVVQDRISVNRASTRVAADLSDQGPIDLAREQASERALANHALAEFESGRLALPAPPLTLPGPTAAGPATK